MREPESTLSSRRFVQPVLDVGNHNEGLLVDDRFSCVGWGGSAVERSGHQTRGKGGADAERHAEPHFARYILRVFRDVLAELGEGVERGGEERRRPERKAMEEISMGTTSG